MSLRGHHFNRSWEKFVNPIVITVLLLIERSLNYSLGLSGNPCHPRQTGHRLRETKRGRSGQDVWLRGRVLGRDAYPLAEDQTKALGAFQRTALVAIGEG